MGYQHRQPRLSSPQPAQPKGRSSLLNEAEKQRILETYELAPKSHGISIP